MDKVCLENTANIATILGFSIALISIWIGILQIKSSKNIEEAKLWLELREIFRNHNEVHIKLRNGGEWTKENQNPETVEDWAAVDAYLGQFEICERLLSKKLIDSETFKAQYEYRLKNIVDNKAIVKKILAEKGSWLNFIDLSLRYGITIFNLKLNED